MARVFTDGGEMRDMLFWDFFTAGEGDCRAAPTLPFASAYYYYTGLGSLYKVLPVPIDECYWRARIFCENTAGTNVKIGALRHSVTDIGFVSFDAIGRFTAVVGSTVVETSTLVGVDYKWYEVEAYFKMADAPNGRFVVYIDGIKFIDFTGDTKPGADVTFDNWEFIGGGGFARLGVDDIAFNDVTGGVDDSYCGDCVIVKVGPNGNGFVNDWHGSDLDDVDNYLMCDEFPNDGDITYVYRDGADVGVQQAFAMDDTYSGTNKTIIRVYAEARARKTSADPYKIGLGQKSGIIGVVSPGRDVLEGQYVRIVGDESKINPSTALPWVEADIDALEFLTEVA
jgi:hypothetical protein